jgi:hypothetical protein
MGGWLLSAGLCLSGCADPQREISRGIEQAGAMASAADAAAPQATADATAPPPPSSSSETAPSSSCGAPTGRNVCDPIHAWPCDLVSGETCDFSHQVGGFVCFPPPNAGKFCDPCNASDLFCGAGTTCGPRGWCDRYCCADSDCSRGRCVLGAIEDPLVAAVGFCEEEGQVTCAGETPTVADTGVPALVPAPSSDAGADEDASARDAQP